MSKLICNTLEGLLKNNNSIEIEPDSKLILPGTIVQTKYIRTDSRLTLTALSSGNGTGIADLNIPFTPKFANSLLLLSWMINYEVIHDVIFVVHKDGALITTPGYEGYNNIAGNNRWSGVMTSYYDQDQSSTMTNGCLRFLIPAENIDPRIYTPAIRSTGTANYTFALNRPINSAGADAYENTISTGVIMEIVQ